MDDLLGSSGNGIFRLNASDIHMFRFLIVKAAGSVHNGARDKGRVKTLPASVRKVFGFLKIRQV